MAKVSRPRLNMGRETSMVEFAQVSFMIEYSPHEVQENISFGLFVPLFEIDDELDTYHWEANGAYNVSANWRNIGDLDDFVTWVTTQNIRPDGDNRRSYRFRKVFDVGDQEGGEEEYKAFVWAIPEVQEGKGWTNTLSVNLG